MKKNIENKLTFPDQKSKYIVKQTNFDKGLNLSRNVHS